MKLLIQRLDGTQYNLEDYGIKVIDFYPLAPKADVAAENVEGRHGWVDMGATYEGRELKGEFVLKTNGYEFVFLRNEIFKIFRSLEPFYIIDLREGGKRWLVRANAYHIQQLFNTRGEFEIDFTSNRPYCESIGTTLTPFTFEAETWAAGMGLVDPSQMIYEHKTNTFEIYNAGVAAIDPVEDELTIKFIGASDGFKILNHTTGDIFEYYGTTIETDVLELNGIETLLNGVNVLGNSNMELITLAEGFNDIEIIGTSGNFNVTFDFRYKYE
jgi:hypothetical protein